MPETLENQDPNPTPQDTPINPPTDNGLPPWQVAVYESRQAAIRAEAERLKLAEENERLRSINSRPTSDPFEPGEPFNDPEKFFGRIKEELNNTVAPLNQFMMEARRKDAYFTLKARLASQNPGAAQALAQVGPMIDNAFLSNPNLLPDEPTFNMVLQNIVGGLFLQGAFNQPNPNPPNNSNPGSPPPIRPVVTPPSSRPSAPPRPVSTPSFDPTQFTENDRRLMREWRMSEPEFIELRDAPPTEAAKIWEKIKTARKAAGGN